MAPSRFVAVIPNLLSLLRLGLAAAFPLISPGWRLSLVAAGGLSDWLDGYIARRFGAKSTSGGLLDAAADKLFALSVLATLTVADLVQWWQVVLVLLRDLAVTFVAAYVALRRDWQAFRRLVPSVTGKLTTVLQFALFITVLAWGDATAARIVLAVTAVCSGLAAADYLAQFAKALREE
ncbi:MAG: CDP-alcohol phosphatidyltransferase family protein [Planctomycetota bacterium]